MPCARCAPVRRDRSIYGAAFQRLRRHWAPIVRAGTVRCGRGEECLRPDLVGGVKVGGLIRPGEPWDLGHHDGEIRGPEHRDCNRGAPSRARRA